MQKEDVRLLRMRMHLTQQQLGELLHMDRGSVIRWENGKTSVPRSIELALDDIYRHWATLTGEDYPLLPDVEQAMQGVARRNFAVVVGGSDGK